jgi:hypothetical protein
MAAFVSRHKVAVTVIAVIAVLLLISSSVYWAVSPA